MNVGVRHALVLGRSTKLLDEVAVHETYGKMFHNNWTVGRQRVMAQYIREFIAPARLLLQHFIITP